MLDPSADPIMVVFFAARFLFVAQSSMLCDLISLHVLKSQILDSYSFFVAALGRGPAVELSFCFFGTVF